MQAQKKSLLKKPYIFPLIILGIALAFIIKRKRAKRKQEHWREDEIIWDPESGLPPYFAHQLIVVLKQDDQNSSRKSILNALKIKERDIKVKRCSVCEGEYELWIGYNLHTGIHGGGVKAGSTPPTITASNDMNGSYALNVVCNQETNTLTDEQALLHQYLQELKNRGDQQLPRKSNKVKIAVIDSGIDLSLFYNEAYLWKNPNKDCHGIGEYGFNFLKGNSDIFDGTANKHGTMVTNYIVQEFLHSPENYPEIMCLKTHDDCGVGSLFANICAISFALKRHVNIINASWGFYNYKHDQFHYITEQIESALKLEGILFIAAAGNQIPEIDSAISLTLASTHTVPYNYNPKRDVSVNGFYPASLAKHYSNNVITVTTCHKGQVSNTQNYCSDSVDLGVTAQLVENNTMAFGIPFLSEAGSLHGSSFAAAIATGKIGAYLPISSYVPHINKQNVLSTLATINVASGQVIHQSNDFTFNQLIRNGKIIHVTS